MKIVIKKPNIGDKNFPLISLLISLGIVLLAPVTSHYLLYIAMLIQLLRIVHYNEHVFIVDIAFLANFSGIFILPNFGGAVGFLVIVAVIWYLIKRKKLKGSRTLLFLTLLCVYIFFRAFGNLIDSVFIVCSLIVMYLLANKCTHRDSVRVAWAFSIGVLIASVYGYLLRGTSVLEYYFSSDSMVSVDYINTFRFRAIFGDSNYYSCALILGIVLIIQLYIVKEAKLKLTVCVIVSLSFFGIITYSRTFFVMLVLVIFFALYLLFKNRKFFPAVILTGGITILIILTLTGKISVFNIVLDRLLGATDLQHMTSGRSSILARYGNYLIHNPKTFLIGEGLAAGLQGKNGTHNLYMEILYYMGSIGLLLMTSFMVSVRHIFKKKCGHKYPVKYVILANLPVLILIVVYFSLQGMFSSTLYLQFLVAFSAYLLPDAMLNHLDW